MYNTPHFLAICIPDELTLNITATLELVSTVGETKGKQTFHRQCLPVRILPSHHESSSEEGSCDVFIRSDVLQSLKNRIGQLI